MSEVNLENTNLEPQISQFVNAKGGAQVKPQDLASSTLAFLTAQTTDLLDAIALDQDIDTDDLQEEIDEESESLSSGTKEKLEELGEEAKGAIEEKIENRRNPEPTSYGSPYIAGGGFQAGPSIAAMLAVQEALSKAERDQNKASNQGLWLSRAATVGQSDAMRKEGHLKAEMDIISGATKGLSGANTLRSGIQSAFTKPDGLKEKQQQLKNIQGYQNAVNDRLKEFNGNSVLSDAEEQRRANTNIGDRLTELKGSKPEDFTESTINETRYAESTSGYRNITPYTDKDAIQKTTDENETKELKKHFDDLEDRTQRDIETTQRKYDAAERRRDLYTTAENHLVEALGDGVKAPLEAALGRQQANAANSAATLQAANSAVSASEQQKNKMSQEATSMNQIMDSVVRSNTQ